MSTVDHIVAFVRALGSALVGPSSETAFDLASIGGFGSDGGEQVSGQVGYSSLGVLGRPLPPEGEDHAEGVALRVHGGLAPVGWRDLRLHRAVNPGGSGGTPAPGQTLLAGYGGAMLSHSMTDEPVGERRANIATWYLPFEFDSAGVPSKAHTISMDPTPGNSSISIVHADGLFVSLTEDGGSGPAVVVAVDGQTFLRMSSGEVTIAAAKIMLKGNVYVGAKPEAGLPLLQGVGSPPCPSLFLSPV